MAVALSRMLGFDPQILPAPGKFCGADGRRGRRVVRQRETERQDQGAWAAGRVGDALDAGLQLPELIDVLRTRLRHPVGP